MKPLMQFGLCCLLAPGLFAADHGVTAAVGGHNSGHPVAVTPNHNAGRVHSSIRTFGNGRYLGYGYGGFYGDYGYQSFNDSAYPPAAEPDGSNATVIYPASPPVAATIHSVIHEYTQPEDYGTPPERGNQPILYLIAFRDKTIRAAMTYWVADGTLHYLDTDHQEKQAPLSAVDRDLSAQINRERHIPFNIQ
jgi:hypothetical protein